MCANFCNCARTFANVRELLQMCAYFCKSARAFGKSARVIVKVRELFQNSARAFVKVRVHLQKYTSFFRTVCQLFGCQDLFANFCFNFKVIVYNFKGKTEI